MDGIIRAICGGTYRRRLKFIIQLGGTKSDQLHRTFYFERCVERDQETLFFFFFKKRGVTWQEIRESSPRKREGFSFVSRASHSIPQSASVRKFFQRRTSMRTMRMQKTDTDLRRVLILPFEISVHFATERNEKLLEIHGPT